MLIEAL